jgi:hypothetical protein
MWVNLMRWKMSGHAVTITLPEMVYEQIRQAAERSHRPVEDVLAEAVAAAAPVMDTPPGTLRSALAHLAYLNDAALWQAARTTMTAEQRERLATLHDKQQRELLTNASLSTWLMHSSPTIASHSFSAFHMRGI